MQAKRTTRENIERDEESPEDNTSLFSTPQQANSIPTPQQCDNSSTPINYYYPRGICIFRATPRTIFRANQRAPQSSNRPSSRARYVTCAQAEGTLSGGTLSNQDKPPPYETAIQLPPPSYEEVERAIFESRNEDSREIQQVEVHVPSTSVTLPANSSTA
ncbi:hypothetical protein CEXT_122641 [Caerostris extrusa]|uniref:Uncharacterized protein n=1 Tax=Caerostris extrusa TaxID=172846 RepID=A0AAV4UIY5_CAEEX|nr:hypothetical protein CEXT_122641 [Caerostris extrusa]